LAVVRVNRADEGEDEAGELRLDGGDHCVDLVAPIRLGHRVDVACVLGPQLVDEMAATLRIGLVPAADVALDHVLHEVPLSAYGRCLVAGTDPGQAGSVCRLRGR